MNADFAPGGVDLLRVATALLVMAGIVATALLLDFWLRRFTRRVMLMSTIPPPFQVVALNAITALVWVVAGTIFLTLNGATWSTFASALGIGTLAVALGLQDVLKSFVGGILILFERPFAIGDRVRINRIEGEVINMQLRIIVIRTNEGHLAQLPNSMLFSEAIENLSQTKLHQRLVLVTSISDTPKNAHVKILNAVHGLAMFQQLPEIVAHPELPEFRLARNFMLPPVHSSVVVSWRSSPDETAHETVVEAIAALYPEARIETRLV